MKLVNDLLRPVFDLLQAPLAGLPAIVGVLVWSIPVGAFALWVFGRTSNQARIAEVKRKIHANLFEIRLFNDDIRAIMRAQWRILGHVLRYQGLALVPMLFILPPLVLVIAQLHQFYGFRGLHPGEQALLTVQLAGDAAPTLARPDIALELPEGVAAEIGPVWVPTLGQASWRLVVEGPGDYELAVRVGDAEVVKTLRATDRLVRMSPERPRPAFVDQLEWPSEPPTGRDSPVSSITLEYPDGGISIFGWDLEWRYAWMVVFFVLTMVVAVVLRKPMGVEL